MKKASVLGLTALSFAWFSHAVAAPIDFNLFFDGTNTIQIAWNAYPGKSYAIQTTTNLVGTWSNITLVATTNWLAASFPTTGRAQFFKLVKLDTEGPEVYQTTPLDGSIAVSRQAVLEARLRDENGINTNSISLAIGSNAPVTLNDSRLTYTSGVLTYTPGTNEFLGTNGEIVTVNFSAADTLGNQTANSTWSFQLELTTVLSSNVMFIGSGGTLGPAVKNAGRNEPNGGRGDCSLTLIFTNGDWFTFSYMGGSSCLSTGMYLVNTNLYTGYTRRVLSFTEYPASNVVVVRTTNAKPAELLQEGSANSSGFTDITPGPSPKGLLSLGLRLDHSVDLQTVLLTNANLLIETLPGSKLDLTGELKLAANFKGFSIKEFEATIGGSADFELYVHALATGAIGFSNSVPVITPIHNFYGGFIGVVPVWVEMVFEVEAGYEANFQGTAEVTNGVQAVKEITVGRRWDQTNGWTVIQQNPPLGLTLLGPIWQVQGSASLRAYLRPKITVYAYSVAGVQGNLEPYAEFDANLQVNPPCLDLGLYAGLDANVGLDLRFWDDSWGDLPDVTYHLIPQTTLWEWNNCTAGPQIVLQPQSQSVSGGGTATFNVQAQGSSLSYQWKRNGLNLTDDTRISGSRTTAIRIGNVQTSDAGNYSVRVSNPAGSVTSTGVRPWQ